MTMVTGIVTVAQVLEAVETDSPDSVIQRLIDTSEMDVRRYSAEDQTERLPVVLLTGTHSVTAGAMSTISTPTANIGSYPIIRFEGTVQGLDWEADTDQLQTAESGTGTITPGGVADAAFMFTANAGRTEIAIDASAATVDSEITRIVGLQTVAHPVDAVQAVIDLVRLGLEFDIVGTQRTGQFSETKKDYDDERFKVLRRIMFSSGESLLA